MNSVQSQLLGDGTLLSFWTSGRSVCPLLDMIAAWLSVEGFTGCLRWT